MHPTAGYIDQHPGELSLTVVDGLVTHKFTVYTQQTRDLSGIRIDASIIGASHILTFDYRGRQFSEILACVSLPPNPSSSLDDLIEGVQRRLWDDGVAYEFQCVRVSWTDPEPNELAELVHRVRGCDPTRELGLLQEFPAGNLQVTPKTVIYGRAESARSVVIETAHSYPNVRGLVLSRTQLTMPEEG